MCVCARKPSYDSSLTDSQWATIEPLLPVRDPRRAGRRLKFPQRLVRDTVLYVLVSGRAWRLVPRDLAPRCWSPPRRSPARARTRPSACGPRTLRSTPWPG
ncbi:transposase, partial [Kitasatospora sp. NPDC001119]